MKYITVIMMFVSALYGGPVHAQTNGSVVSSCGSASYSAGQSKSLTVDVNGNLCSNATVTTSGAPITAVTPTDKGGTLTLGGAAQNAMTANTSRKGGWIQNPCSATEDLYVSTTGSATTTGSGDDADLAPCGSYSLIQNGLIIRRDVSVNAATTSHRWIAVETQ